MQLKSFKVDIIGEAVPSGRPRVTRTGHVYKPQKSRNYEDSAAITAAEEYRKQGGTEPMSGEITLIVDEFRRIPKSWSESKKKQAISGEIAPTGKPDIDNTVKAAMDILTKAGVWGDDSQVVNLYASKVYGIEARLSIFVKKPEL